MPVAAVAASVVCGWGWESGGPYIYIYISCKIHLSFLWYNPKECARVCVCSLRMSAQTLGIYAATAAANGRNTSMMGIF